MSEHFIRCSLDISFDEVMSWLNSLFDTPVVLPGSYSKMGHITKIIDWQVVPTGRPYEYNVIARVEIEPEDKEKTSGSESGRTAT